MENVQTDCEPGPSKKRKINEMLETSKEKETKDEPRKTRGVRLDYHHLNNPFSDKDKIDANDTEANILFALTAETRDEFCSIK